MIALLAVYIELSTPGIGLPGAVAVICFAVLFGSKYLVGLATWWEVALFIAGVVLLMIEIFVIPGFGFTGVAGIICIVIGMFAILVPNRPDELPWPQYEFDWQILANGALALGLGFGGFIVLAALFAKYLPKMQFLSGIALGAAPAAAPREIIMSAPVQSQKQPISVGDVGVVLSPLRPVGEAKFGEAVIDVVAAGEFLDKNQKIKITEIHGNRVVVEAITEES